MQESKQEVTKLYSLWKNNCSRNLRADTFTGDRKIKFDRVASLKNILISLTVCKRDRDLPS